MNTQPSTELPKTYDPKAVEPQANAVWTDEKLFHAEPTDPGQPYAIVIPPPNVTAALHLGHALNNTLQDILTRWRRMAGDNAIWLPGTDHAGIATQTVVEKRVLAEEGKRRTEFQRDEFVKKIQTWKDEYERRITEQLKAMGCSCDWDRQAFTMDEPRAKAVREAFFQLFKDGLIYRGKRLVNWDPATQTALADDEVEMEEIDGHFYYLRYPLVDDDATPIPSPSGSASSFPSPSGRGQGEGARGVDTRLTPHAPSPQPSPGGRGGKMQYVTVATTRPETMLGDTAVAINPKDPRAAALRGKSVRLPIVNRIIPIIEDDYVVLPDPTSSDAKAQFATGFLKVTPAHDPNDYDIGLRHKLPVINVLAPDGTISDQHGWPKEDVEAGDAEFLLGQDRFEARAAVVEWFRKNDLLEEVKPYRHSVGHSYRSHVPIEPYLSDQWYCKVTDDRLAGAALRAMNTEQVDSRGTGASPVSAAQPQIDSRSAGTHGRGAHATKDWHGNLKFYPARYAKTFQTWHENIRDWCISRQLWWGHRIPVWSFKHDAAVDSKKDEHLASLIEKVLQLRGAGRIAIHTPARESDKSAIDLQHAFICVRTEGDAEAIKALEELGFAQDPDVLDTWFSSGLWPMSTLGWPEMTPALAKWNPTHTLSTDRGIITLWVGRMVMFNLYFLDRLPFTEVFIHATVLDDKGRKMSKSLGNGVDPLDIIESHGADAMRFTLTLMTTQTQDVRMPVEKDAKSGKNTSPKFDIGRNFCNKLWNAARFAMMSLAPSPLQGEGGDEGRSAASSSGAGSPNVSPLTPALSPRGEREQGSLADRWIISRFNRTVASCEASLREYRFDQYAKTCYDFFWGDFCDWYLEAIKPAMKDPARAAATANVLASILDGALRLLHPMIPFITETIWWKLNEVRPNRGLPGQLECAPNPRLIKAAWPKITATDDAAEATFAKLQEVIGALRNLRNQHKVDPKRTITVTISAPDDAGRQIEANRELVELLAICQIKQIGENLAGSEKAARASAGTIAMFVEGMADEAAEQQRTAKRCEELKKQIAALRGRLSNEAYIKKAPPKLVDETKQQLADAEAEAAKLGCK